MSPQRKSSRPYKPFRPDQKGRIELHNWYLAQQQFAEQFGTKRLSLYAVVVDALCHHPKGATVMDLSLWIAEHYGIRQNVELRAAIARVLERGRDDYDEMEQSKRGWTYVGGWRESTEEKPTYVH